MNKAILFLVFNRLDTTQKTFEQIRIAKPPRLYVASDGGRESKAGEKEAVEQVRKWILDNVDWDCEVKTLFREENLSCKFAVSSALNWFFEQESDGIVLEDDCVPTQSFFSFTEELLDKYRDDKRVWHITGDNPLNLYDCGASYYFSHVEQCWGWATWADRWQNFDINMPDFENNMQKIKEIMPNRYTYNYWLERFSGCKKNEINSWAYIWTYTIMKEHGLCINPAKNLITNIGYDGVHFSNPTDEPLLNRQNYEMPEMIHPQEVKVDESAVKRIYKESLRINRFLDLYKYVKIRPFFLFKPKFWELLLK